MTVITRFAPSPTGFLHIGGARTALFNYLYSKHMGGKFLLRIEDTDQKRSTLAATQAILNGLKWLGINYDDKEVMQSHNIEAHRSIAEKLLENNKAYYCYCPPKRADEPGEVEKCNCKNLNSAGNKNNVKPSVRIAINKEESTTVNDLVLGNIVVNNKELDDFIILRSDGTPTYLLAVVVDDINMNITHIIRGDDHLTNTFRQLQIYKALGITAPLYAHIPLIYGEDGTKMSKRHGALGVEEYIDLGYLKEAVCNYLLRLGWSHGNDEIISIEDAIKWFDIKDVNKSPARFDFNKLNSINGYYIKNKPLNELLELALPFVNKYAESFKFSINYQAKLAKLMPFLQLRCKTLVEIAENAIFIIVDTIAIDEEWVAPLKNNLPMLQEQLSLLEKAKVFDRVTLHEVIKNYAESKGLKLGKVVEGLRIALTGKNLSPASVFDIMEILGKENSITRIKAVIKI